jgi:hypothetical protein
MDKAAEEAKRLLPCLWAAHGGHPYSQERGKPCECSTCLRRPDITAALRQRDERIAELEADNADLSEAVDGAIKDREYYNIELGKCEARVQALLSVEARLINVSGERNNLRAQLATAQAEIECLKSPKT